MVLLPYYTFVVVVSVVVQPGVGKISVHIVVVVDVDVWNVVVLVNVNQYLQTGIVVLSLCWSRALQKCFWL